MYFRRKGIGSRIPFLSLSVWLGAWVPVLADGATRDLPDLYCSGVVLTVSITTDAPPGTVVVILEDHPPDGWTDVGNISDEGSYDAENHAVKWGPWFENFSRTVTYEVTPPGGATGAQCFDGDVSFDGNPWESIGGDQCLPAPYCGDGCCGAGEDTCICPLDCGSQCDDGCCNGGEDTCNCVFDCGSQCGDGCCNGGEDLSNCSGDCGTRVPTLSEWNLVVMGLLMATAGTLICRRRVLSKNSIAP